METDLHVRDKVGLQDFLLLEDYQNEDAFIENLKKRHEGDLIYTYIGQVLISLNPYKELNIYTEDFVKEYQRKHFFEKPPHVFAIAENAFRSLIEENIGQCILISGESGSGKTEASKKVLQYIAAASEHESTVESVKDKLLQSNPVLEAFGNAKTNRNDNSSRFGKYMDIQFNFTGEPIGGNILNYLLEKSRVTHQMPGERNFHIFYQLLAGADDQQLSELSLKRDLSSYYYLSDGNKGEVSRIPDKSNFKAVISALETIGMTSDRSHIFGILASVLHLGNVKFDEENDKSQVVSKDLVKTISKLLKCDEEKLINALTHRTIDARGDVVVSPMDKEMAIYARDALSKAVYDRLFTWIVRKINEILHIKSSDRLTHVIGILDIYGFEIFGKNSFEQFCINFCNEKLQQLFIELTLKSEQEEYLREGIEWVPVPYFNNKIICNLIEETHKGIIAVMDEECLRPGNPNDMSFLAKMNTNLVKHEHFISHSKASLAIQKVMGRDEFRLVHYAGEVTYNVKGFLDKNNDLLFRDLKEVMSKSENEIIRSCFPEAEYLDKKRPNTAVTKFKTSLNQLMDILMCKEPSYIRCIKPTDHQIPNNFDTELVRHQVKYLGLMENLRVRRAGFAYRRTYELFLSRYKCLSKQTWPSYNGPVKDGVQILVNELKYDKEEYRMGKTKLFIRSPTTLFATEDAFQRKKHDLVSKIKAVWKGRRQRLAYLKMKEQITIVQSYLRRYLAQQRLKKRKAAVAIIRGFLKGFITRNDPPNTFNESFIAHAKKQWLIRLSKNLPKKILDHNWPSCPKHCTEASLYLRRLHKLYLIRHYKKNLSNDRKRMLELKVLSEQLFKGKKRSYPKSIGPWFMNDRTNTLLKTPINNFVKINFGTESLKYASSVIKYDRHGYKPRERILLLSEKAVYILDAKSFKQKHRLSLEKIEFCMTSELDSLLIIRIPPELKDDKGDLILEIPEIIELSVWIVDVSKNKNILIIIDQASIDHNLVKGKSGMIEIQQGPQPQITRAKSGNLLVVGGQ